METTAKRIRIIIIVVVVVIRAKEMNGARVRIRANKVCVGELANEC